MNINETKDIIYFEINTWLKGVSYPDTDTFNDWVGNDLDIKFQDEDWVIENELCVTLNIIDMKVNICVSAKKDWVIENCPELLTKYRQFLRYPCEDIIYEHDFLVYKKENIGIKEID